MKAFVGLVKRVELQMIVWQGYIHNNNNSLSIHSITLYYDKWPLVQD